MWDHQGSWLSTRSSSYLRNAAVRAYANSGCKPGPTTYHIDSMRQTMRTTYRIDIRKVEADVPSTTRWQPQTRLKNRKDAESVADTWRARGFEVQIVAEK